MQSYINSHPTSWFIKPFYSEVGLQISLDGSSDNAISSAEKTIFEMLEEAQRLISFHH